MSELSHAFWYLLRVGGVSPLGPPSVVDGADDVEEGIEAMIE